MKKLRFIIPLLFCLLIGLGGNSVNANTVVPIKGGKMIDNRTLVPLRSIFEELGTTVNWDQSTKTITANKNTTNISLKIGAKTSTVNGQSIAIDVPAQVINGATLVPLRFISEALGATVKWDSKTLTATIEQDGKTISVKVENSIVKGNRNFLKITDAEIKEAIQEGNKGVYHMLGIKKQYKVPVASDAFKLRGYQPVVEINTPYSTVLGVAALKANKYETLSFSEGKKWVETYKKLGSISFTIESYGSSIDIIYNPVKVILQQGDKYIYPSDITSIDVSRTASWPNDPSYKENISFEFPTNKINMNQNATLILKMINDTLITYNVDFSNYK